jgi:hypothetical protein
VSPYVILLGIQPTALPNDSKALLHFVTNLGLTEKGNLTVFSLYFFKGKTSYRRLLRTWHPDEGKLQNK